MPASSRVASRAPHRRSPAQHADRGRPAGGIDDPVGQLVQRLRSRQDELEEAIYSRITGAGEVAGDGDPGYAHGMRSAVHAVLDYALLVTGGGGDYPRAPADAIAQARRGAQKQIGIETVLKRYIVGQRVLGEYILEEAERTEIGPDGPALCRLRATLDALLEHLTAEISDAYMRERKAIDRAADECPIDVVEQLLAGERPDTRAIDYEFETAWHLAVIARGPNSRQFVTELAVALRRRLLAVPTGPGSTWAWLGDGKRFDASYISQVLADQGRRSVAMVLGEPRWGLAGFRISHHEAQAALLVAARRPQRVIRFADVALEALSLQNPILARCFTDIYALSLSLPIARETLRAYVAAGCNKTTAAAALGIDRSTMWRRLQAIANKLERPLDSCLIELEVAIRLGELGV